MTPQLKKRLIAYGIGAVLFGIYLSFLVLATFVWADGWILGLFKNHYVFFVGLPFAGGLAYFIVGTLELARGPVEFELGGLKFKGASGPIIVWVLVYMTIAASFAIAWNLKA